MPVRPDSRRSGSYRTASLLCLCLSGCANKPLPENTIFGANTIAIVDKIRCEAKDAVRTELITYLHEQETHYTADRNIFRDVIADIEKIDDEIPDSVFEALPSSVIKEIDKYYNAGISYYFKFNISENNTSTASLTLTDPWLTGVFTGVVKGTNDRTRRNERTFKIKETVPQLFKDLKEEVCLGSMRAGLAHDDRRRFLYPITGSIGLKEMVNTFRSLVERNVLTSLPGADSKDMAMADEIVFTTKNSASLDPALSLTPPYVGIHLLALSGGLSSYREDIHSVIIGLAIPPPMENEGAPPPSKAADRPANVRRPPARPQRTSRRSLPANVTGNAADAAGRAVDSVILQNSLILNRGDLKQILQSR